MNKRLTDKVAVISGGTSGIGEATVELFVQEGARVVFSGRSIEKGKPLQSEQELFIFKQMLCLKKILKVLFKRRLITLAA